MNLNLNLKAIVNPVRSLWEELVERRLWPILVVLVIALVAVPVMLSKPAKEAQPLPPTPAATSTGSPAAAFQPAVTTEGRKSSQIRKRVNSFKRKNPFTPQGVTQRSAGAGAGTATIAGGGGAVTPTTTSDPGALTAGGSSPGSGGTTQSGDSVGGSGGGTSTKSFYYHYTVDVKFGKAGNLDKKTLTDFRALPSSDNPVLVFMGVKNDGATAVFLMTANASTLGDGTCAPTDTECTFLYLKKGDKQTIEAVNADGSITDYGLKLLSVDVKRTKGPDKAASSKAHRSAHRAKRSAHRAKRSAHRAKRSAHRAKQRSRLRRVVKSFRTLGF
jgi:hypothetical protein